MRLRLFKGVRGPGYGLLFVYNAPESWSLAEHWNFLKSYDSWTHEDYAQMQPQLAKVQPVACFVAEKDWSVQLICWTY